MKTECPAITELTLTLDYDLRSSLQTIIMHQDKTSVWWRIRQKALDYTNARIEKFNSLPPEYFTDSIERRQIERNSSSESVSKKSS